MLLAYTKPLRPNWPWQGNKRYCNQPRD